MRPPVESNSKRSRLVLIAGLLLALVVALTLRLPEPTARPMHNDEAVNAIKFRALMEHGDYRYDPREYHGPTLYYFTLAWTKLTGASDFTKLTEARLRGLTVCFGVGLILLLPLIRDGLGKRATVVAAMLIAISPAMVFYSRYYIHEMQLVFFTLLAIAAGWRWFRTGKLRWAILTGAAIGLMHATKETFVLSLAAMALAVFLNGKWVRTGNSAVRPLTPALSPAGGKGDSVMRARVRGSRIKAATAVLVAWIIVAVVFFSSFFSHPHGVLDSITTFLPMSHRATDSAHMHPWDLYFERLLFFHVQGGPIWSEAFIFILALAGIFSAFTRHGAAESNPDFARFIAIYTIVLTAIYTAIPYKTPWCALNFWLGAILLAGIGAAAIWNAARRWRIVIATIFVAATAHLSVQSWRASIPCSSDQRNPYVYAQTSPDILELVSEVESIAQASHLGNHMSISVVAEGNDYWPLPWYLRNFDEAGWWDKPPDNSSSTFIASSIHKARFDEDNSLVSAGTFQLRPGNFLTLFVRTNVWRAYVDSKSNQDR